MLPHQIAGFIRDRGDHKTDALNNLTVPKHRRSDSMNVIRCMSGLFLVAMFAVDVEANDLRIVALTGQHAPNFLSDITFDRFIQVKIGDSGDTVFRGAILGSSSEVNEENSIGLWREENQSLRLFLQEGDQAPGAPDGAVFGRFGKPVIFNSQNELLFRTTLRNGAGGVTSDNNDSRWREQDGELHLLAREGSQAPGAPGGAVFGRLGQRTPTPHNQFGEIAFVGALQLGGGGVNSDNYKGIWSEKGGSLDLIARGGDQIPGMPAGTYFGTDFSGVSIGDSGHTTFQGKILSDTPSESYDWGFWMAEPDNTIRLIARTGGSALGTPEGSVFNNFRKFSESPDGDGRVAFTADLRIGQGDVTEENNEGIWSDLGGELSLVAREGWIASGTDGALFGGFDSIERLNDEGHTVFGARLQHHPGTVTEANDSGIWSEEIDGLRLLAREGSHAPGTPEGAVFERLFSPWQTKSGQTWVRAKLRSGLGGVNDDNSIGMWAEDENGDLQLVIRMGDLIEVAPDDFRTLSSFSYDINEQGQLAIKADFTDRSQGILVSSLMAVPEPSTWLLTIFAALGTFLVNRKRNRLQAH